MTERENNEPVNRLEEKLVGVAREIDTIISSVGHKNWRRDSYVLQYFEMAIYQIIIY
jgi:hypothetical protein